MHASNTSPWTLVARSLVEPCGDGALRTTLHSAVVRALDYLSESESSRTSSLGPGKLRPSSRREQRTGGALQTLEVEGRAAATALRSKAWNATLGALSASRSSSSAAFPASSGTVTPPGSPRTSSSASGPPSLCSRAPIAEALVLTHLVLVEMECVEHVLADCLIEVDAALSAWQKQHGSGPIEHVLETLSEAPTELQTPTPSTPAGDAIVKLGSIWNQKVRLLGRLERYAQQLRYVWRQVVRRCLWDSAHGSPRMEEDEYLGRIAATVLREHFAASPAERGADGTDARADAAATASDAQCVAGLLEMLFDAMIVVEDVLGLSNSIKLLEETNVQLEGVEVASQAGGGAGGAGARGSRRGKKEQLGKTYGQIAHHRACVESQLATGGAQEPPRRLPRSLQGVVVVPSRGSTSKSGGGAGGVNKRAPFSLLSADLTPSAWTVAAKVKVALLAAGALLGGVALVKHRGKVLGTVSAVGAFFASHVIEPIKVIVQEVFEHQRGKSITDEVAIVDAKVRCFVSWIPARSFSLVCACSHAPTRDAGATHSTPSPAPARATALNAQHARQLLRRCTPGCGRRLSLRQSQRDRHGGCLARLRARDSKAGRLDESARRDDGDWERAAAALDASAVHEDAAPRGYASVRRSFFPFVLSFFPRRPTLDCACLRRLFFPLGACPSRAHPALVCVCVLDPSCSSSLPPLPAHARAAAWTTFAYRTSSTCSSWRSFQRVSSPRSPRWRPSAPRAPAGFFPPRARAAASRTSASAASR